MDFRRSGQRDERRRRVLLDETGASDETSSDASGEALDSRSASQPVRRYTEGALSPRQPRVIDLIPTRRWTNLVLLLVCLSCVAGLEAVYGYVALRPVPAGVGAYPAIDLAARGSVATWLNAALLAVSAVMGILTYQIRRYRVDDYRGRYRMWYWLVFVLFVGSVDSVAGVQQSVRTALLEAARIPEYADALLIWTAALAVILSAMAVRLAIEVRACRVAVFCLVATLACFGVVGASQLDWILKGSDVFPTMVRSALTMGGHIALLMAICLYARHVYRDASGQVVSKLSRKRNTGQRPPKRRQAKATSGAAGSDATSSTRRIKGSVLRRDPPHTPGEESASESSAASGEGAKPRPAAALKEKRRVAAEVMEAPGSGSGGLCTPDDDQIEDSPKLSKAERRRMRKQRRRETP